MIFFDDNHMKVGGVILPGIYKSIEISHDAQVEEQEVEGSAKAPKQAIGYEDAKVTIELSLEEGETLTIHDKLQIIQNLFRREGQHLPEIFPIINAHTAIRGITQVVFKKLSTKETNKGEEVTASLEFWEYVPMTISAVKSGGNSSDVENSPGGASVAGTGLNENYESYLGEDRGNAPSQGARRHINKAKTGKSPARDDPNWRPYR